MKKIFFLILTISIIAIVIYNLKSPISLFSNAKQANSEQVNGYTTNKNIIDLENWTNKCGQCIDGQTCCINGLANYYANLPAGYINGVFPLKMKFLDKKYQYYYQLKQNNYSYINNNVNIEKLFINRELPYQNFCHLNALSNFIKVIGIEQPFSNFLTNKIKLTYTEIFQQNSKTRLLTNQKLSLPELIFLRYYIKRNGENNYVLKTIEVGQTKTRIDQYGSMPIDGLQKVLTEMTADIQQIYKNYDPKVDYFNKSNDVMTSVTKNKILNSIKQQKILFLRVALNSKRFSDALKYKKGVEHYLIAIDMYMINKNQQNFERYFIIDSLDELNLGFIGWTGLHYFSSDTIEYESVDTDFNLNNNMNQINSRQHTAIYDIISTNTIVQKSGLEIK